MGYISFSKELVERYLTNVKSVIDFGSQNDFSKAETIPPFISEWYEMKGIKYTSVDLAGDNNSLQINWCIPITDLGEFDLVVDAGSSEHSAIADEYTNVKYNDNLNSIYPKGESNSELGYYNCWLNKFNLCKVGGLIISENPKTKSWIGHGFSYLTEKFYRDLFCVADIEILELGEHAACHNYVDGWNIFSVIKKTGNKFPSFDVFKTLEKFNQ